MKTLPFQKNRLVIWIFAFVMLFTPFKVNGQNTESKTQVQQNREAIMMQMNQKNVPDSLSIQVMDTATANAWWKRLHEAKKKGANTPGRSDNFFDKIETRQASPSSSFQQPPVRIRTKSQSGNRVAVFIENTTQKPLRNFSISVNQLPDEWSADSKKRIAEVLAPGHQQQFTFTFSGDGVPEQVGFTFAMGDSLFINWSANIKLGLTNKKQNEILPQKFEVHGTYPNPFSSSTTISYSLPKPMEMHIVIYNVLGQRVATMEKNQQAGTQSMTWNAANLASGIYFCRLTARSSSGEEHVVQLKMMRIK